VFWIESPDPEKALAVSAEDASEFAVWFRERVKEINGIDLTVAAQPPLRTVTLDYGA
jgi:hypothetical protein